MLKILVFFLQFLLPNEMLKELFVWGHAINSLVVIDGIIEVNEAQRALNT